MNFRAGGQAGFDKSKVRCFKCQQPGHFARECRSGGQGQHQGQRSNPTSSALVSQEGNGFDWSDQAEEATHNKALMALTDSSIKMDSPETEDIQVSSKLCPGECRAIVKRFREHNKKVCAALSRMEERRYETSAVIESFEKKIKDYQANELQMDNDRKYHKWEKEQLQEEIDSLKKKLSEKESKIDELTKKLDGVDMDLSMFKASTLKLETLLQSQIRNKVKTGLGYKQTPPPYNHNYITPMCDVADRDVNEPLEEELKSADPQFESEEEGVVYEVSDDKKEGVVKKEEVIPIENHIWCEPTAPKSSSQPVMFVKASSEPSTNAILVIDIGNIRS